jgi:glutamate racemase
VSDSPIGVFDSGFGGLTIFRCIRDLLPQYDYVYLGDNARTPYGNRSFETVLKFTAEGVRHLFSLNCPLVIIACNTASAKALRSVQQQILPGEFPGRRVLGVIRPTVEGIDRCTQTNTVALWATAGTVKSQSFALEMQKYAPRVALVQQACPLLVPLVEAGEITGPGLEFFVTKYWELTARQSPDIDALLLACTHYPLILPAIRAAVPQRVRIVTQGELVAPSLAGYLQRHPEIETRLTRVGTRRFLTTDACEYFDGLAEGFMGHPLSSEMADITAPAM